MNYKVLILISFIEILLCKSEAISKNQLVYDLIQQYRDPDIDPCDDYFKYACSKWIHVHKNEEYFENLGFLDYKANTKFLDILELIKNESLLNQPKFVRNIVNHYSACTAMSDESYEPKKFLDWLEQHENIQWPSEKKDSHHSYDWVALLGILAKYGLNGVFVEKGVYTHPNNTHLILIDIDKPIFNADFEPLTYEFVKSNLPRGMHILKLKSTWRKIKHIELTLKQLIDREDDLKVQYFRISSLKSHWVYDFLSHIIEGYGLSHKTKISIQNFAYLTAVKNLVLNVGENTAGIYIKLRFLYYLQNIQPDFYSERNCVTNLRNTMPLAMNCLFQQHQQDALQTSEEVEQIFSALIEQFRNILKNNVNGFEKSVLKFLYDKTNIQINIGNVPEGNSTDKVEKLYANLAIDPYDYYGNMLSMLYFNTQQYYFLKSSYAQTNVFMFDQDEEAYIKSDSSPYFNSIYNAVIVPRTLLQLPVFHKDLHDVFKYGYLGFLLSHGIVHEFDSSEVTLDRWGMDRSSENPIKSNELFALNLECLMQANSTETDEKIADVVGIRLAFETYFRNVNTSSIISFGNEDHAKTERADHLFFLNFANFFCGDLENDFSNNRQHLIDALSHFDTFASTYNCPVGSPMNPERKCQLYR